MPDSVLQIDSEVCPQRILISNLPKMDTETMLNKLEIHFSKRRNGGGEVEDCEMLPDSGTVVLTFVDDDSEQILLVYMMPSQLIQLVHFGGRLQTTADPKDKR